MWKNFFLKKLTFQLQFEFGCFGLILHVNGPNLCPAFNCCLAIQISVRLKFCCSMNSAWFAGRLVFNSNSLGRVLRWLAEPSFVSVILCISSFVLFAGELLTSITLTILEVLVVWSAKLSCVFVVIVEGDERKLFF